MACLGLAHHEDQSEASRQLTQWVSRAMDMRYQRFVPSEAWTPAVNIYEDDAQYHVVVDLAGISPEQMDLKITPKGQMILSGRRSMPEPCASPGGNLRVLLMEIDHGEFLRSIQLPQDAAVDRVEAASRRAGLLWICIPRKR